MVESFYLSNIVPQNLENNAGFWNRFEMYCRDLTKKYSSVYIVSGPLVLPQPDETGKKYVKYEVCFNFIHSFLRLKKNAASLENHNLGQLMRLWYLSQRRPAKAQASLRIRAVLPEPSLFAHISRRRVRPKIRHLAPPDGCECAIEEWVYCARKVP